MWVIVGGRNLAVAEQQKMFDPRDQQLLAGSRACVGWRRSSMRPVRSKCDRRFPLENSEPTCLGKEARNGRARRASE